MEFLELLLDVLCSFHAGTPCHFIALLMCVGDLRNPLWGHSSSFYSQTPCAEVNAHRFMSMICLARPPAWYIYIYRNTHPLALGFTDSILGCSAGSSSQLHLLLALLAAVLGGSRNRSSSALSCPENKTGLQPDRLPWGLARVLRLDLWLAESFQVALKYSSLVFPFSGASGVLAMRLRFGVFGPTSSSSSCSETIFCIWVVV